MNAQEFDEVFEAIEKSKVYGDFCRKVYGTDLIQYNMVTASQLSKLEEVCGLSSGKTFIDLGSGGGWLTRYLADQFQAKGLGIDYAERAVERCQEKYSDNDLLEFQKDDIETLSTIDQKFDLVLSMDTLYFVEDRFQTLDRWLELIAPGGKLVVFFSQMITDPKNKHKLNVDDSDVGAHLRKRGIRYQAWDYTEEERELWNTADPEMRVIKQALEEEGGLALYEGWIEACERVNQNYRDGNQARFLYVAEMP